MSGGFKAPRDPITHGAEVAARQAEQLRELSRPSGAQLSLAEDVATLGLNWQVLSWGDISGLTDWSIPLPDGFVKHRITHRLKTAAAALGGGVMHELGGADVTSGYDMHFWQSASDTTVNALSIPVNPNIFVVGSSSSRLMTTIIELEHARIPGDTLFRGDFMGTQNPATARVHLTYGGVVEQLGEYDSFHVTLASVVSTGWWQLEGLPAPSFLL